MQVFPLALSPWVQYVNLESSQLMKFAGTMDQSLLKRVLIEAMSESQEFPLRTEFRGLVVGERVLTVASAPSGTSGNAKLAFTGTRRYLEVVPLGYTDESFNLLGPILIPSDRPLQEGSIVVASVTLLDPREHTVVPTGLLAEGNDLHAQVAVEP